MNHHAACPHVELGYSLEKRREEISFFREYR